MTYTTHAYFPHAKKPALIWSFNLFLISYFSFQSLKVDAGSAKRGIRGPKHTQPGPEQNSDNTAVKNYDRTEPCVVVDVSGSQEEKETDHQDQGNAGIPEQGTRTEQ